jgi:ABC-2 type transport system permease protein
MTALDFRPDAAAQPFWALVARHAAMETRLLLRNGEQLVLAVVIPVLLLVGGVEAGGVVDLGAGRRVDVLSPGVLALAVLSTSFTSLAIATAFERRYGVLKRLGASPLSRTGLLLGKVGSLLVVECAQLVLLGVVAALLGWQPAGGVAAAAGAALLVVVGTWTFAALGLLMAGTLRAEATLAAANLVYVLLLLGGAVVLPLASYPEALQPFVAALPSGALAEGLREACGGEGLGWSRLLVLGAWGAVATLVTRRTFRWE